MVPYKYMYTYTNKYQIQNMYVHLHIHRYTSVLIVFKACALLIFWVVSRGHMCVTPLHSCASGHARFGSKRTGARMVAV